jgi:hypothetical protein
MNFPAHWFRERMKFLELASTSLAIGQRGLNTVCQPSTSVNRMFEVEGAAFQSGDAATGGIFRWDLASFVAGLCGKRRSLGVSIFAARVTSGGRVPQYLTASRLAKARGSC